MELSSVLGLHFPLKISLITPLHIGSGDNYSPYADYILDKQSNVALMDADAFASLLVEQNQTDHFIRDVIDSASISKKDVISQFVRYDLNKDIDKLLTGKFLPGHGIQNPILIARHINTDNKYFIPGSSLKGAFMHALFNQWLLSGDVMANNAMYSFLNELSYLITEYDKKSEEIKNRYSHGKELKKVKDKLNAIYEKEVQKYYDTLLETVFFGKPNQKEKMLAACVRITDSSSNSKGGAVYQCNRYNFETEDTDQDKNIPVLKECVAPGNHFTTSIRLDRYNYADKSFHRDLSFLQNKVHLFEMLNRASMVALKYEIEQIENCNVDLAYRDCYLDQLTKLKELISTSNNQKGFLRLGQGKAQYYQTLALPLFKLLGSDENNQDWINYVWFCSGFKEKIPDTYPKTRMLTSNGQVPLGWISLE